MAITDYLKSQGVKKLKKRRGRGQGSGHGKTSCRGHKGQKARGNTKKAKGFEGGQMPLMRRLPKHGFTNIFRKEYQVINIKRLSSLKADTIVTLELLVEKGYIKTANSLTKILGGGKLQKKLEVHAHAFSENAKKAISEAGGTAIIESLKKKQTIKE